MNIGHMTDGSLVILTQNNLLECRSSSAAYGGNTKHDLVEGVLADNYQFICFFLLVCAFASIISTKY